MTTAIQHDDRPRAGVEIVHELIRAFKVRRLYDSGHPQRRELEEHSAARIAAILEETGAMDLILESERILLGDTPVHQQPEGRDSIVYLLHREGVRQVSLYPGLTVEELGVFLDDVAAVGLTIAEDEFDLVARLWERNFVHIRYAFVEQLLDEDWTPPAAEWKEDPEQDQQPIVILDEDKRATDYLREVDPTLYFLDDADMASLQRELESEKDRTLLHETLTCLLEILWAMGSDDPTAMVSAIAEVHESFLDDGLYDEVVRLHGVFEPYWQREGAQAERPPEFAALLARTLAPEVLHRLAIQVEDGRVAEQEAATYYRFFGRGRLRTLLAHCGDLKRLCQRPVLAEALIDLAREESWQLRLAITDPDPVTACPAAYLAGLLGEGALLEPLARALEVGDDPVRREALLAAKQIGGRRALEVIAQRIEDSDPTVRLYALRHVVSHRYAPALSRVAPLLDRVGGRSLTERRLVYEAYGALGGVEVLGELGKRLRRREGLFRKVDPEEQACVLVALAAVGTKEARALVEETSNARNPLVQRTAQEILATWGDRGAVRR